MLGLGVGVGVERLEGASKTSITDSRVLLPVMASETWKLPESWVPSKVKEYSRSP